jgi:hypothetical protein
MCWVELCLVRTRLRLGKGEAFNDNPSSLEVGDAVVGAMPHKNRFTEQGDEWTRVIEKETVGGLFKVDDEIVGDIAFRAYEGRFERAMERGYGEFAYWLGARAYGCDGQGHLFCRLSHSRF